MVGKPPAVMMESLQTTFAMSVCIATYKRPDLLRELLSSLAAQEVVDDSYDIELIIIDNDENGSAKKIVDSFRTSCAWPVVYRTISPPNISLARNECLQAARHPTLLFVDDDQLLPPRLFTGLREFWLSLDERVSGCQLSKELHFRSSIPPWLAKANVFGKYDVDDHQHIPGRDIHTSGIVFRRRVFAKHGLQFDVDLGLTGGEDNDFFGRAADCGELFVGCRLSTIEQITQPRTEISYILRRAFHVGRLHAAVHLKAATPWQKTPYIFYTATRILYATATLCLNGFRGRARFLEATARLTRQFGKVATVACGLRGQFYRRAGERIRTLYFHTRPHHRQRQRETFENCPRQVQAVVPPVENYIVETAVMFPPESLAERIKRHVLLLFFPLCIRPIVNAAAERADALFTWGVFPLGGAKPYYIELENPYQLCMYQVKWFRFLRVILRSLLRNPMCKGIVCISEACRQNLKTELGDDIAAKARILYPYIADYSDRRRGSANERVEFLFVSTQFRPKGGLETARAFHRLASLYENIHLTMVTNLSPEDERELAELKHITVVQALLDRQALHRNYFAKADVFILPTSWDSSPMVVLEAVSFGLPVISSRVYAIPEMVIHGETGLLINPGFLYYDTEGRANERLWNSRGMEQATSIYYQEVEDQVVEHIQTLLDGELRKAMAKKALEHFQQRFAPPVWQRNFLALLEDPSPNELAEPTPLPSTQRV